MHVTLRDPATLERDCAKQDWPACLELSERYSSGRGVDLERERAAALRARACEHGHARSCGSLGSQYAFGQGTADEPKARQYYARGCELEDAWSCEGLAPLETMSRRDELYTRAFELHIRACERDDARGCFGASSLFGNHRVKTDVPPAVWEAARAREAARCTSGTDDEAFDSCWASWRMFDAGLGGPANPDEAARAARRGCERKQRTMCSVLAHAHEQGRGVRRDEARAKALYVRACKLGDAYACYFAANREPDPQRQLALRRRACDAGNLGDCATVIEALDNGDPVTARALRERSCRRGWADSCIELGDALVAARRGADAMPWYTRACRDDSASTGCVRAATIHREACDKGDAAACRELDAELAKLPVDRRVAVMHACCASRPDLRTLPGGALLLFFDALVAKDVAGVKAFVHARQGLQVRLGWHDDSGSSEERYQLRANATALGKLVELTRPDPDSLRCDALVADGSVTCRSFGGGYGATFDLLRENGRFYVTGIDEESH